MSEISKEYNFREVEEKWIERWDPSVYYFDWGSEKPQYIIDTPPPYPTGNFHIGNALNWCYIDFVARYKRMRGYNVMFPQGWDCHGLPTEVKVEETYHITKNQVPREEFRRLCEEMTAQAIERMRRTITRLGISTDWSNEYITMKPEYYVKTQRSFVQMYEKGMIYREDHPVNWCPRCATAIAFAEVEYDTRTTTLNYMRFESDYGSLEIATTRPELLPACVAVAVNPNDERHIGFVGKSVKVPLFDYEVPVLSDPAVDPSFGTGVVMICTFGDKQDVRWWVEHNLPLRQAIDREGRLTEIAGKFKGMSITEAKNAIVDEMLSRGIIYRQEPLEQNAGLRDGPVQGSHGVRVIPETTFDQVDLDSVDAIVLPGGNPGFINLGNDERVLDAVRKMSAAGKYVAAICGAPSVLVKAGVLSGRMATVHPAGKDEVAACARYMDERVVVDGKIVTRRMLQSTVASLRSQRML